MPTASREIIVSNSMGLHARPAMQFVDTANQFKSEIKVKKPALPATENTEASEATEADGKSVMQMIVLEATMGTPLTIEANGDDAEEAVKQLVALFESKFGEE